MNIILDGNFYQYKLVPWELYDDSNIPWTNCNPEEHLLEIPIKHAGEFVLYIKNSSEEANETFSYRISVKPQWFQTLVFKICIGSTLLLVLFGLLFRRYRSNQKQKIAAIQKQKAELDISLSSMRSQLNPHFIFNALNSIQGLISSTQYDKASEYLVDFSMLLRKPLNPNDIKHWTLSDETELLQTYIKLEQLRVPFHFEFLMDENLSSNLIRFPALLLQPLVENAIKHGLAKTSAPVLRMNIRKENQDLIISITDNGKGFDATQTYTGNGLKLSKEYIELINKQFPETNTSINFGTNNNGTTVIITFQNWLDE
jgi:LytS/YehU family sensor histidine kinase